MMKCDAAECTSNENTEINGKIITLFSFPTHDDTLVKQWEENSKINNEVCKNLKDLKLCELHFEFTNFVTEENKKTLAPGAVPTIFEFNENKKMNDEKTKGDKKEEEAEEVREEPPCKQIKLEATEEVLILKTSPPQSPQIETESEVLKNDFETPKKDDSHVEEKNLNNKLGDSSTSTSLFTKQLDMGKKVYRLIIRIDKVTINKREIKKTDNTLESRNVNDRSNISKPNDEGSKNSIVATKLCSKTGCKLVKTTLNSKPVFRCERCDKFYVVKENKTDKKDLTCYICKEISPDSETLNYHIKKHFTCDMCQAQCTTQISFDKHIRLHVSTDPLLPYKCHKCVNTFEVKADVREHYALKHTKIINKQDKIKNKLLFRCEYCYAVFTKQDAYKNHVELHVAKGEFDCSLCSKKFKSSKHLAIHQARHLGAVKFTCRVCGKEFNSFEDVEIHMKIHVDIVMEENKCNICKKSFENEASLNVHMRGHLSRAHRCPLCKKAFINKTTLRIHFKTHNKVPELPKAKDLLQAKKHTCTLCPSKFESRSQLYNHIMTHLEQMHGVDGEDNVLQGLDQLLETDDDILS